MDMKKLIIVVVISVFGGTFAGFLVGKSVGATETTESLTVVGVQKANPWYKPWADDEYVVVRADGSSEKIIIK
jgi:hypothetical protein